MLRKRIISALVLIPLALAGAGLGAGYFAALVALFGAAMAWEWVRVCNRGTFPPGGVVAVLAVPAAVLALHLSAGAAALALLAGGAVLAGLAGLPGRRALWHGLGVLYVGLPCLALLWIRDDPESGLPTLLWTLVLVWSVDTGAYIAGRGIGGPKLAPRISPNKTWAGLAGGVVAAVVMAALAALGLGFGALWPVAALAALLAVVEQAGDLAESGFKRHFGVKDSSNLIPGHGGVLDRLDGLLAVSIAVAGLMMITKGGVPAWR
ncbi:MAG: phosphatidate cytidylyltransferase [Dongiaceae bacterium]